MDFFDQLIDLISDFAKELRDRFGAWIVDWLGKLLRIVLKGTAKFLYITISMLCPYFAWASGGQYLFSHGGWLLGGLGIFIVMVFPCFVVAQTVMRWASVAPAISTQPIPEVTQTKEMPPANDSSPWYSRLGAQLLGIFVSEGRNTPAYYGIFVTIAIVITGLMLFTSAGKPLSETFFGSLNSRILSVIVRGPVWLGTTAYAMASGVVLSWDASVFETIIGLPRGTGFLGYLAAIAVIGVSLLLAGWFLYGFSQPSVAEPKTDVARETGIDQTGATS